MKPSQPEDVGAGSNVPVQPDALGKTQQQDQLNPFAATSASSSPDAGPRTNWAAASLVLGITPLCILFISGLFPPNSGVYFLSWGGVMAISAVVCGVVGIIQAKRASYKGIPRRDIPMAFAGVIMGGIVMLLVMLCFLLVAAIER